MPPSQLVKSLSCNCCALGGPLLNAYWWEAFPSSKSPPHLLHLARYYDMIGQMSHFYGMHPTFETHSNWSLVYSLLNPRRSPFQPYHCISLGLGLGGCLVEARWRKQMVQVHWPRSWAWECAPPATSSLRCGSDRVSRCQSGVAQCDHARKEKTDTHFLYIICSPSHRRTASHWCHHSN